MKLGNTVDMTTYFERTLISGVRSKVRCFGREKQGASCYGSSPELSHGVKGWCHQPTNQKTPRSDFHPGMMTGADGTGFASPKLLSCQKSYLLPFSMPCRGKKTLSAHRTLQPQPHQARVETPDFYPGSWYKVLCRHGTKEELLIK